MLEPSCVFGHCLRGGERGEGGEGRVMIGMEKGGRGKGGGECGVAVEGGVEESDRKEDRRVVVRGPSVNFV